MDFLLLTYVSCKYLVALWWLQQATLRLKLEPGSLVMMATQIMEDFLGKDKIQSLQVGFTELDGFAPEDKSNSWSCLLCDTEKARSSLAKASKVKVSRSGKTRAPIKCCTNQPYAEETVTIRNVWTP